MLVAVLARLSGVTHFPFESGGSGQSRAISSGFRNDPAEGKDADSTEKKDWISRQNRVAGKVAQSRSEQT